jgi:hypothetical protein
VNVSINNWKLNRAITHVITKWNFCLIYNQIISSRALHGSLTIVWISYILFVHCYQLRWNQMTIRECKFKFNMAFITNDKLTMIIEFNGVRGWLQKWYWFRHYIIWFCLVLKQQGKNVHHLNTKFKENVADEW